MRGRDEGAELRCSERSCFLFTGARSPPSPPLGQAGRGRAQGGERLMGATARGGNGFRAPAPGSQSGPMGGRLGRQTACRARTAGGGVARDGVAGEAGVEG